MADFRAFVLLTILGFSFGNSLVIKSGNERITTRIAGGRRATEGQFPYQVSITDMFKGHICGGAILNEQWVLTAARCLKRVHITSFFMVAGVTDMSELIPPSSIYFAEKMIFDESYNLVLVKTEKPIVFSESVKKIDLPTSNNNVKDTPVVISGWGSSYWGGAVSKHLQYLSSKVFDQETCKQSLAQVANFPPVVDTNLCTFIPSGSLCDGDSGDPVVAGDFLIGIAMYGPPCSRGYPEVSANVWNYVNWIKSHINEQ